MTADPLLDPRAAARAAATVGLRESLLIVLGYIPFGIAAGIALASTNLGAGLSLASSPIIFAGGAQLVAAQLIDQGAAVALVVLTVAVVNARHLLYSASLQPHLADWSTGQRMLGAFLLADPVFALTSRRFAGGAQSRGERLAYYFTVGITCLLGWTVLTVLGYVAGQFVPDSVPLGLAIPLTFLLLVLPLITDLPGVVAGVVGGLVALAARDLPLGTGILLGAVAGLIAGGLLVAYRSRREPTEEAPA